MGLDSYLKELTQNSKLKTQNSKLKTQNSNANTCYRLWYQALWYRGNR